MMNNIKGFGKTLMVLCPFINLTNKELSKYRIG
jgi:hypothetical protein